MPSNWCFFCYISSNFVHRTMMCFLGGFDGTVSGKVHKLSRAWFWRNACCSTCWQVQNESRIRTRDRIIWMESTQLINYGSHCSFRGVVRCQEGFFSLVPTPSLPARLWLSWPITQFAFPYTPYTLQGPNILYCISFPYCVETKSGSCNSVQINSTQLNSNDNDADIVTTETHPTKNDSDRH